MLDKVDKLYLDAAVKAGLPWEDMESKVKDWKRREYQSSAFAQSLKPTTQSTNPLLSRPPRAVGAREGI